QRFEVLGAELVDAVRPDPGDQVAVHRCAVPDQGVVADGLCGDVLHPVHEPLLNCPRTTRLPGLAAVSLLFELPDGLDHGTFALALDVATVGLAVVADAHGYPAVPVAVRSLEDGAGAVGSSGAVGVLLLACHQASASSVRRCVYAVRASAGMRRRRPTRTVVMCPALMSAYMVVRPTESR